MHGTSHGALGAVAQELQSFIENFKALYRWCSTLPALCFPHPFFHALCSATMDALWLNSRDILLVCGRILSARLDGAMSVLRDAFFVLSCHNIVWWLKMCVPQWPSGHANQVYSRHDEITQGPRRPQASCSPCAHPSLAGNLLAGGCNLGSHPQGFGSPPFSLIVCLQPVTGTRCAFTAHVDFLTRSRRS